MKLFCIELFSWPFFAVILSNMLWCKIFIWSLPNTLRTIGGLYWLRCLFQFIEIYILFTLNGRCVFYVNNSSCMIPCRYAKGDMTTLKRYSPPLPKSNAISLQSRLLLLYDRASITWTKCGCPIAEQDDDPGYTRDFEVQIVYLVVSVGLWVEIVVWIPSLT